MRHLFSDALHIFVIFMMACFIIGGILAITGTFDHWGSRYILKKRRRRLLRNRFKGTTDTDTNADNMIKMTPYYTAKPDKGSIVYKGRYA